MVSLLYTGLGDPFCAACVLEEFAQEGGAGWHGRFLWGEGRRCRYDIVPFFNVYVVALT